MVNVSMIGGSAIVTPAPPGSLYPSATRDVAGKRRRRRSPSARARQAVPLVLVVDDVADQRDIYSQYLRFLGYRVETAVNGFDALAKVRALDPDLVVMDLSMPLMDGFEATRALKADPATRDIPIIALTAYSLHLPEEWALSAGCAAYLRKPCLPADLESTIRKALSGSPS
jgi:CheY-like chemotaxis protein